jgi:hypothetical protein
LKTHRIERAVFVPFEEHRGSGSSILLTR